MKNSGVSARIPSENARKLDLLGINITDLINNAINNVIWDSDRIKKEIEIKELEVKTLKKLWVKVEKEKIERKSDLKKFFKQSKTILYNNPESITGRIRVLNNIFKIPLDEYKFKEMMDEYTN